MRSILLGLALVLSGAILPFLMVIQVVESSLWLSLLSYAVSLIGLVLGIVAATTFFRPKVHP